MSTSIKKIVLDIIAGAIQPVSGSSLRIDEMQKKIEDLSEENTKLKRLYLKTTVDMNSMQEIVKVMAMNQAQLASDLHTIYTAVRDAGIIEELDEEAPMETASEATSMWVTRSGSLGGTGGMLN
jgi:hypothetical protein